MYKAVNDVLRRNPELCTKGAAGVIIGMFFAEGQGHTHWHFTGDKTIDVRLWKDAAEFLGQTPGGERQPPLSNNKNEWEKASHRKVILRNGFSPGDIVTMTRAVADLAMTYPNWRIDVRSPCPAIWENCPYITELDETAPDVEVFDIKYDAINDSGWSGIHFTDAFRLNIEQQLGCKITKTGYKPELWISDMEKSWINQVEVQFGWKGPFWLLNAGRKPDNELKQYHRWQEVVDLLNEFFQGRIKIVQIGHKDHIHPELNGVLSLVGKTDLRQLIRLAWWAHGTIGPLSLQFVISAALGQSHVVVAAGKEGVPWHLYPHGRYIYTNGALNCCAWDGCWLGGKKGRCVDLIDEVPHCMRLIEPYMIADAVKMYYRGGRLGWGRGK